MIPKSRFAEKDQAQQEKGPSQVTATIAGRQFRLACEDGQEEHLQMLAKSIDERIAELRQKFGEIGDTRLTVMAALTVAPSVRQRCLGGQAPAETAASK